MNKAQVKAKMEQLLYLLRQEQELRDQASSLQFVGVSEKTVQESMKQESDILKAIETLRQEKLIPLLKEVAAFVATKTPGAGSGVAATAKSTPKAASAKPAAKRKPAASGAGR